MIFDHLIYPNDKKNRIDGYDPGWTTLPPKRLEIETGETALPCVDKYNKQPKYFHQQASSQTHAQTARTYGLFGFYGNKIPMN
jgi:hypothetical protein